MRITKQKGTAYFTKKKKKSVGLALVACWETVRLSGDHGLCYSHADNKISLYWFDMDNE